MGFQLQPKSCFLGVFAVFTVVLNGSCFSHANRLQATVHTTPRDQPNILIIVGDDHAGGTLGIDGDTHQATPRLDQLAREGVRFRRAYCNSPVCTPSRQSFLTGRLPHATGVTQLTTPLDEKTITLADWLGANGYDTCAIGKMHFNSNLKHGFDQRVDTIDWSRWLTLHHPIMAARLAPFRPFATPAPVWLNAANAPMPLPIELMESTYFVDQARDYFKKARDRPFFLTVSFNTPHSPFAFPEGWNAKNKPADFDIPAMSDFDRQEQPKVFQHLTPNEFRGIQAAYYNSISFHDNSVGRVLDALEASGHANDTIVVYLGDNGCLRGYHGRFEKHSLYEQAVRVPLLIRWPKHLPANRAVDAMVELVDLFPTLMDLSGQEKPGNLHGTSLAPLARGEANAKGREIVFSEYLENEEAMIRSERYKLILGTGARQRQDGYENGLPPPGPSIRLYDELLDPGELIDISNLPEHAPLIARLQHELYQRLTGTRDDLKPVLPAGLSELEAIHWCLIPRDKVSVPPAAKNQNAVKNGQSKH